MSLARWTLISQLGLLVCAVSSSAQPVPQNAHKNPFGPGWTCNRGYHNAGGRCVAVQIPENAQLNFLGNGWDCKRGFRNAGGRCVAVQIPENAQLNIVGNDWDCKYGFKKVGVGCQQMSPAELAAYNKLLRQHLMRRRTLVGGGNTYTTSKGAEFSIRVTNTDLNCREGFDGGFDSCEIEIDFAVTTNYNGNDDPNVQLRCEIEVSYEDKSGFEGTKSEDDSKSISMYDQNYTGSMEIDVSFYEAARRVRLTEAACRISSVD
jgi:hypothetical protein